MGRIKFLTISAEITTDCQTSTVTFDVFVAASISISETFNICENDTIYVFGAAVSDAGIFIDTIPGIVLRFHPYYYSEYGRYN